MLQVMWLVQIILIGFCKSCDSFKSFWLDVASHVTRFNHSECFISLYCTVLMLWQNLFTTTAPGEFLKNKIGLSLWHRWQSGGFQHQMRTRVRIEHLGEAVNSIEKLKIMEADHSDNKTLIFSLTHNLVSINQEPNL